MQPALDSDLMRRVVDPRNVARAWSQVRRNAGAGGVDGISMEDFPVFGRAHWLAIRSAVLDGTYRPQPVLRRVIPKRSGGERLLGIPTVLDRVIQQAIAQVLTPIFDPHGS
jgi:RNA-directed DNA polymerase